MVEKTIFNIEMKSGKPYGYVHDPEAALVDDPRVQIAKGGPWLELKKNNGAAGLMLKQSEIESIDWRPAPVKKDKADKAEEGEIVVH